MLDKKINVAILLGAGKGSRLSSEIPKQYIPIKNQDSAFTYVLEAFLKHPMISYVLPVISREHQYYYQKVVSKVSEQFLGIELKLLPFCLGGKERKDSVYNALKMLQNQNIDKVLIHDVARPFVSQQIITNSLINTKDGIGVVPATIISDTVKRAEDNFVYEEVDRSNLYAMQTPQSFMYKEILQSYDNFLNFNFSDDSSYYLKNNYKIKLIEGDVKNTKITYEKDVKMLLMLNNLDKGNNASNFNQKTLEKNNKSENLQKRAKGVFIGQGIDIHEFSSSAFDNKELFLGGIKIPYHRGLKGHSDADVVLHALVDAILGALGKGDIGDFFPPSDNQWKGVSSKLFLEFARDMLYKEEMYINNIDITILAEEPKIGKHKEMIKANIGSILGIAQDIINIKATTAEKLGFVGRKEGIAVFAIISIQNF